MIRRRFDAVVLAGLFCIMVSGSGMASSARTAWQDKPYPCVILSQDIRTVIAEFGENVGIATIIAADVRGHVQHVSSKDHALTFLERLTKSFNLDWYYNGSSIFVTPRSDEHDAQLSLGGSSFERLKETLISSGGFDDRYVLKPGSANTVIVAGPPAYIDTVRGRIVKFISAGATGMQRLTVFRGTQSSAVNVP